MEKKILTPPSGNSDMKIIYESTRKRKLTAADQQETGSEIDSKLFLLKKPNLLPKTLQNDQTFNQSLEACLESNDQTLNTADSSLAIAALEPCACTEHGENNRSLQNVMAVNKGTLGLCLSNKLREGDKGFGDGNIQMMMKTKGSNLNSSLLLGLSPKNDDSPTDAVENDQRSENNFAASKSSNEKGILLAGKLAPSTAEKLWVGSLQLSSSVTVSAVAFFKSGEKKRDIKWSNIAEVRGKVRLDAFEKYIQDLSRSRNRGLMVISLCCREGSSKSELLAMKKVAKGYKEGNRVGFVQLSPGIDLYVCPCSDTIITILAKHGFFKGMAAVVNNKDSLIGCVVWRKNRVSTNSAPKEFDRKNCSSKHAINSSCNQSSAEKDLLCAQSIQDSTLVASEAKSSTHETAGSSRNEDKHLKDSEIARNNLSPSTSVLRPETFSDSNCTMDSASLRGSMTQLSKDVAPPIHKSRIQKPELGLKHQKPILSLPSDVSKQSTSTLDDDDLPEFDFGTACSISQTPVNKSVDAATTDQKILVKGLRKKDGSMQPTVRTVQWLSTLNEQRSEIFNHAMFRLEDINRMPLLKKVYEHEEPQTIRSRGVKMPVSATAVTLKNRFNGDDNMPEWHPPTFQPRTTSPSTTFVPPRISYTTFGSFSPFRPSPLLVAVPPFSTNTLHRENHQTINTTMKMVQPRIPDGYVERRPSSSVELDGNLLLRPPTDAVAINTYVPQKGWGGWRP